MTATIEARPDLAIGRSGTSAVSPVSPGGPAPVAPASVSEPLRLLVRAVGLLRRQRPSDLPGAQALAEAALLLAELEKLTAVSLARLADVDRRQLSVLAGAPTTGRWLAGLQVGVDRDRLALARKLHRLPAVAEQVENGSLPLPGAARIGRALDRVRPFLDRPDGLLDGQPQDAVLTAVIVDGVLSLLGTARGGWPTDDPQWVALEGELLAIAAAPNSAAGRLEAAFVVLARQLEPAWLSSALDQLVDALLPLQLEDRAARAHRDRGIVLSRKRDGSGWRISEGDLDLELGELMHTVLTAQSGTDPVNPDDTAGWASARAAQPDDPEGWVAARRAHPTSPAGDDAPGQALAGDGASEPSPRSSEGRDGSVSAGSESGGAPAPRSVRQRHHDAMKLALRRLLDSGALGHRDKAAPHISITVSLDLLHSAPGALPAVGGSGMILPRSLVTRMLCDSALTRVLLSAQRRVIETSHSERTLKSHERTALNLQWGGRCAGAGCGSPPGTPLIPHHATPWHLTGTTSFTDSVPLCASTHQDLHVGGHTLRLRDGRYLSPTGWVAVPDGQAPPPEP